MHHPTICAAAVALLAAFPGAQAGMYTKKSPVLQVDGKDWDRLIAKSNQTSIVEFYAPWCGHCQNLKPAYEKAAKHLEGLAKVAAVDCDDEMNKAFCGQMGVQGFPTLKIVKPKKTGGGKPMVEDYQGPRTAKDIVEAVTQRINNHVQKVDDKNLDRFLREKNNTAKAILLTEKGTTSALLKSIAIDFLGVITVGQARSKEAKTVAMFGVDKFPTLVLLPGGDAAAVVYDGEMNKADMVQFLSQAAEPNPDPAPKKAKVDEKKKPKADSKASDTTSADIPVKEAPVIVETALPIPAINSQEKLIKECLTDKSHTCVLAFVPAEPIDQSKQALSSLSDLAFKHSQSQRHLFPFFEVPRTIEGVDPLLKKLGLSGEVEIVALNARRGWWRHYDATTGDFGLEAVEGWIDAIRLGEGVKKKLPEGIVAISVESAAPSSEDAKPEAAATKADAAPGSTDTAEEATAATAVTSGEAASDTESEAFSQATPTQATDPTAEPETAAPGHDEL